MNARSQRQYNIGFKKGFKDGVIARAKMEQTIYLYKRLDRSPIQLLEYLMEKFDLTRNEAIDEIENFWYSDLSKHALERGLLRGGIKQAIKLYKKFGKSIDETIEYLREEFDLTEEEAQERIKEYKRYY